MKAENISIIEYMHRPTITHNGLETFSTVPKLRQWLRESHPDHEHYAIETSRTTGLNVAVSSEPKQEILGVSIEYHGPNGRNERIAVLIDEKLNEEEVGEVRRKLAQYYVDVSEDNLD